MEIRFLRRFNAFFLCVAAAGVLACVGLQAPACAAPVDPAALPKIEKDLESQRSEVLELNKKVELTRDELQALREKLVEATQSLQEKQKDQEAGAQRLAMLEKQAETNIEKMKETQGRLRTLTQALVRLARLPPEIFLLQIAPVKDHIHRALLLRALLPRLRDDTAQMAEKLVEVEDLRKTVAAQQQLVAAANQNLEWQRANLDAMIKMRQGSLQKTVAEREAMAAQLASLAAEAKDLKQLLDKVNKPLPHEKGNAARKDGAKEKEKDLRPPVSGRVLRAFGSKDETGIASQGVTYSAAAGSPIVAPRKGRVVFTGPFRGYGQIVILQHENGHHSFIAGFGRIDAEMNQTIEKGEPLGILAATSPAPELYFEWRDHNEPIDPWG